MDSSSWVHFFRRKGDPAVATRVRKLIEAGEAAWCPPVRVELWNGARDDSDRRMLRQFEQCLPDLEVNVDVWKAACELATRCRKTGKTAPAVDVIIAACARHHGAEVEHDDAHYDFLMKL